MERGLKQAMDFIFNSMHNQSVRVSLYHYDHTEGQGEPHLQINAELKALFKKHGFKWKTVTNDMRTGLRVEYMEC